MAVHHVENGEASIRIQRHLKNGDRIKMSTYVDDQHTFVHLTADEAEKIIEDLQFQVMAVKYDRDNDC
jgi:hypothetical protein